MCNKKYLVSIKVDMHDKPQTLHIIGKNDADILNKLNKTFKNRNDIHLKIIKKEPINESG